MSETFENQIKVTDSEESLCGTAEPGGFLSVHKGPGRVTQLVVVSVELWMHYHPSAANCSRLQSTSASLVVRPRCLNFLNKSSEKRRGEQQRSQIPTVPTH